MKWNEKSKNLALLGLAVQVEYLSNLYSYKSSFFWVAS